MWANCCPVWTKLDEQRIFYSGKNYTAPLSIQLTPLDELVSCEPGFTGLSSPMDMVQVPNLKSFNFFANDWKQKADTTK